MIPTTTTTPLPLPSPLPGECVPRADGGGGGARSTPVALTSPSSSLAWPKTFKSAARDVYSARTLRKAYAALPSSSFMCSWLPSPFPPLFTHKQQASFLSSDAAVYPLPARPVQSPLRPAKQLPDLFQTTVTARPAGLLVCPAWWSRGASSCLHRVLRVKLKLLGFYSASFHRFRSFSLLSERGGKEGRLSFVRSFLPFVESFVACVCLSLSLFVLGSWIESVWFAV